MGHSVKACANGVLGISDPDHILEPEKDMAESTTGFNEFLFDEQVPCDEVSTSEVLGDQDGVQGGLV